MAAQDTPEPRRPPRTVAATAALLVIVTVAMHAQSTAPEPSRQRPAARVVRGRVLASGSDVPLRHARVQAKTGDRVLASVLTDAEGAFAASIPAAGATHLVVGKPGYLTHDMSAPRGGADLDVRLTKAAVISGRITDTTGNPVSGMTVTAELPGSAAATSTAVATGRTDDLGDYRLSGLREGRYLVSVNSIAPAIGEAATIVNELPDGGRTTQISAPVPGEMRRRMQVRVYFPATESR